MLERFRIPRTIDGVKKSTEQYQRLLKKMFSGLNQEVRVRVQSGIEIGFELDFAVGFE